MVLFVLVLLPNYEVLFGFIVPFSDELLSGKVGGRIGDVWFELLVIGCTGTVVFVVLVGVSVLFLGAYIYG